MTNTITISRTLSGREQTLLAWLAFVLFWGGTGVLLKVAVRIVRVGW
jgi:hypothetical protein